MLDLDHFKEINDRYGHLVGDAVLREAARRMQAEIRRYDAVGRYGGEEFLIVLSNCDCRNAQAQAERVREAVGGQPMLVDGHSVRVTCSIGVSCSVNACESESDGLIRDADVALYRAKGEGRDRVVALSPGDGLPAK